ncbi:MAG: hypothetical protein ACREYC_13475 [Gammaproteobacteria bacterium]
MAGWASAPARSVGEQASGALGIAPLVISQSWCPGGRGVPPCRGVIGDRLAAGSWASGAARSTGSQPAISGNEDPAGPIKGWKETHGSASIGGQAGGWSAGRHLDAAPLRCDLLGGDGCRGLVHGRDGMTI